MADRDYVFTATLDEREIIDVLKNIDKNVETLASTIEEAFNRLENSATKSFSGVGDQIQKETKKATKGVDEVTSAVEDLAGAAKGLKSGFELPEVAAPDNVEIEEIKSRATGPPITSVPAPITDETYEQVRGFVAQYTRDLEALEQQSASNVAEQLKLTAALNETDEEFIDNAASMARTSDEFVEIIQDSGKFSSSQIKIAQSLALVEAGLKDTENATGSLTDRSQHLNQMRSILEGLADSESEYVSELRTSIEETDIAGDVADALRQSISALSESFRQSFSLDEAREELNSLEDLLVDVVGKERATEIFNFETARENLQRLEQVIQEIYDAENEGRLIDAQKAREDLLDIREQAIAALDVGGQADLISVQRARGEIDEVQGFVNELFANEQDVIDPEDGKELVDRVDRLKALLSQDYKVLDTDEAKQEVTQLRERITQLFDDEEVQLEFGDDHLLALYQLQNIDRFMDEIDSRKIDLVDVDLLEEDVNTAQSLLNQLLSEETEERQLFDFGTTLTQLEQVRQRLIDLVGEERANEIIDFNQLFNQLAEVENRFDTIFDDIPDAGDPFNFERALDTLDKVEIQYKDLLEGEEGDPLGLDESRIRLDDLQEDLRRLVSGEERADLFDFGEARQELDYLEEQLVSLVGRDVADKILDFDAARAQLNTIESKVIKILGEAREEGIFDLDDAGAQLDRLREKLDFSEIFKEQDIGSLLNFGGAINSLDSYNDKATQLRQINVEATESVDGLANAQRAIASATGQAASEQDLLNATTKSLAETEANRQQSLVNLAAAELRAAVGADKVTNSYIQLAAAGSENLGVFSDVLSQNNRVTQSQVELAAELAKIKNRIQSVTAQLNNQDLPVGRYEELQGELQSLIVRYEDYNGQLRKTATAQKKGESELLRAVKIYPDVREEVEGLTEKYGSFTVAVGVAASEQGEAQQEFLKSVKTNESLANELERLEKEYGQFNAVVSKAAVTQSTYYNAGQRAERQFLKTLRTFPAIRQEVSNLTDKYGTFRVQVGRAADEQGEAQQEFMKAVGQDARLRRELDRLNEEYGDFVVTVDRASVAQQGFNKNISGTRLGALSGIFQELTRRIINFGEEAVRALQRILKESVGIAKQFEQTGAAFVGIFGAENADIALDVMKRVRQESERLGVALEPILPRLFPRVQDFEQAIQVAELIPGLAASAPDLGPDDALRAVNEALAGDLVSLRRAFEIPVGGIQKAQDELGVVRGTIVGLTEELESMGLTFEQQEDTAYIAINRIQQSFVSLQSVLGEPILIGLKDGLTEVSEAIADNRDDIELFIQQLGEFLGVAIEEGLAGAAEVIDDIDFEGLARKANELEDIVIQIKALEEAISELVDTWEEFKSGFVLFDVPKFIKEDLGIDIEENFNNMFKTEAGAEFWRQILTGSFKDIVDLEEALNTLNLSLRTHRIYYAEAAAAGDVFRKGIVDVIKGTKTLDELIREAATAGVAAYDREAAEAAEEVGNLNRELNENEEAFERSAEATKEADLATQAYTNSILKLNNLQKELASLKVGDRIDEDILDSTLEVYDAFSDLQLDDLDFGTGIIEEVKRFEGEFASAISDLSSEITGSMSPELQSALNELSGDLNSFSFEGLGLEEVIAPSFTGITGDLVQLADEYILDTDDLKGVVDPELLEAQGEINEEIAAFIQETKEKQLEIIQSYNDKIYDLEIELSRKREEIARKTAQDIRDAFTKLSDDMEDLEIRRAREREDLALKAAREEADIELEKQQKLIDAEENFRNKLAEIRRKFDFDQREALRANDAVTFLRLQRRREFELNEARIDYEQKRDDVIDEADKQRNELKKTLKEEEEDLEKSLKRREEDLAKSHARKLRDIIQAGEDELKELNRYEEEKRADILLSLQRQQRDFEASVYKKEATLRASLAERRNLVVTRLGEIAQIEADILKERANQYLLLAQQAVAAFGLIEDANWDLLRALDQHPRYQQDQPDSSNDVTENPTLDAAQYDSSDTTASLGELRVAARQAVYDASIPEQDKFRLINWISDTTEQDRKELIDLIERLGGVVPRATGGPFSAYDNLLVGERGPEVVSFNRSGYVIPNHELMGSSLTPSRVVNNVDQSRKANIDLSLLDPSYLSASQKAIIKQMIQETMLEVL